MSREQSGGLSVTTLLLASASAATASIVVPLVWEGGGVVAAAITPIIVALTSEGLKRPVQKVQTAGVWRRTSRGTMVREGWTDFRPLESDDERYEVAPERPDDPFGLREPERRVIFTRRRVKIALTTAALAFAIAAVAVTVSELVIGDSVSTPHRTTFFGGRSSKQADATPTPAATPQPGETATPAPAETPATGATPEPTATPAATATPGAAAPESTAAPTP